MGGKKPWGLRGLGALNWVAHVIAVPLVVRGRSFAYGLLLRFSGTSRDQSADSCAKYLF